MIDWLKVCEAFAKARHTGDMEDENRAFDVARAVTGYCTESDDEFRVYCHKALSDEILREGLACVVRFVLRPTVDDLITFLRQHGFDGEADDIEDADEYKKAIADCLCDVSWHEGHVSDGTPEDETFYEMVRERYRRCLDAL